jgi:hypothetical protein
MQRILVCGCLAACLWGCGGGEVVAIRVVHPDGTPSEPNPSGYFVCEPDPGAPTFKCEGKQAFHQYDRLAEAGTCEYGLASVYVETGGAKRIQFACAKPPTTDFPLDTAPPAAPGSPAPAPSASTGAPTPVAPPPGGH